ncbi:signal recognition particle receptor, B subunit, isoform CRA_a [Homo sapiens]|nr:signal recognition particle receptor, B subunit, isoform CRA_a [Homo sapiens]
MKLVDFQLHYFQLPLKFTGNTLSSPLRISLICGHSYEVSPHVKTGTK